MPGLVPGIHVLFHGGQDVDGRDEPAMTRQGEAVLHVGRRCERRLAVSLAFFLFVAPAALHAQTIPGALPESAKALAHGEWPAYAGTYAAARYSPLTQIDKDNVKNCASPGAGSRRMPRSTRQSPMSAERCQ